MHTTSRDPLAREWTARVTAAAAVLAVALACRRPVADDAQGAADASVLVQVGTIVRGSLAETISAVGLVDWDTSRVRTIPTLAAGEVAEVYVVPGSAVQRGALLARIGPVPADLPDARRAWIEVEYARRDLARVEWLRPDGFATNADVENAQKALNLALANLDGVGTPAAGRAERTHVVLAPEDGVITQVRVSPGLRIQSGHAAFALAPTDAMLVRVGFTVSVARRVCAGADVRLIPLFAGAGAAPISARLDERSLLVDPGSQLAAALIRAPDMARRMRAGERVRVDIAQTAVAQALLVPLAALSLRENQEGVFVVEGDRARWRPLVIGARGDSQVQALSGIDAGDAVVISGQSNLEDGTPIQRGGPERG